MTTSLSITAALATVLNTKATLDKDLDGLFNGPVSGATAAFQQFQADYDVLSANLVALNSAVSGFVSGFGALWSSAFSSAFGNG